MVSDRMVFPVVLLLAEGTVFCKFGNRPACRRLSSTVFVTFLVTSAVKLATSIAALLDPSGFASALCLDRLDLVSIPLAVLRLLALITCKTLR